MGAVDWRATLTVLTGKQAGKVLVLDRNQVTVGRADDAGLVIDDPGVSAHHARVAQTAHGTFYVEDLASAHGTFLGANAVGVALLRGGDILRLGPSAQLRFDVIDPFGATS